MGQGRRGLGGERCRVGTSVAAEREDFIEACQQTSRQQRRIAAAASAWLALNPHDIDKDIRFDAVLVAPGKIPRHIPAAFLAE